MGNSYRFVLNINGEPIKDYFVWNDNTNNGGINTRPLRTNGTIKSGDVVSVEMQSVDETAYLYYFALSQLAGNGPGGGTTPSNPPNNISGGALGLFSAHTSQSKSIVIPISSIWEKIFFWKNPVSLLKSDGVLSLLLHKKLPISRSIFYQNIHALWQIANVYGRNTICIRQIVFYNSAIHVYDLQRSI